MEDDTTKLIEKLIGELKVNDEKAASEYEETPKEPREAINALVKIGRPAVESLLKLLKDDSKYSCLYAIKVLGEIRDPRAVEPIIEAFSRSDLEAFDDEEDYDQPRLALQKIGIPALEPILNYLEQAKKKDNIDGVVFSIRTLGHIKDEKAFMALVNMLPDPNKEFVEWAISSLETYGDKRAIEPLKKLLENIDTRDAAVEALRKLMPPQQYRDTIAPYALEHLKPLRDEIDRSLRTLEYAHEDAQEPSPRFEGDDAQELNAIALERSIRESVENLLESAIELGVYEAVIPDDVGNKLSRELWKTQEKWRKFKNEHEEEMDIVQGRISIVSEMTKSYKGLTRTSWGPNPKLDDLRMKIWEWLKKQEFLVTREHSHLWARKRKKEARKGCYVAVVRDDERPRSWGLVHLSLWGEAWTSSETETFTNAFWEYVEKITTQLVGKRKLQIQIVET